MYHIVLTLMLIQIATLGAASSALSSAYEQALQTTIKVVLPHNAHRHIVTETNVNWHQSTSMLAVTTVVVEHANQHEAEIFAKHMAATTSYCLGSWRQRAVDEIKATEDTKQQPLHPTLLAWITLTCDTELRWPEYLMFIERPEKITFHYSLHTAQQNEPKRDLFWINYHDGIERFADHPSPDFAQRVTEGDEKAEQLWHEYLNFQKTIGIKFDYAHLHAMYKQLLALNHK